MSEKVVITSKVSKVSEFDGNFNDGEKLLIGTKDKSIGVLDKLGNLIPMLELPDLTITSDVTGHIKIPTKTHTFIVQWSSKTVSADSTNTFTFPIPFPNACFHIIHGQKNNDPVTGLMVWAIDNVSYNIKITGGIGTEVISFIAIGY